MKKALLLFGLTSLMQAAPVISSVTCDAPTAHSIRCSWITDVSSTTVIKWGTAAGVYGTTLNRGTFDNTAHSVTASVPSAATTYYAVACSTASGETCSTEQQVTTGSSPSNTEPVAPAQVENDGPVGTGTTRTVGTDCGHASTGLQALWNASALGDRIIIPTTTSNCTGVVLTDKGAGTDAILITTDSTNLPPAGVRVGDARWTLSKIYRSHFNFQELDAAGVNALTGKVALANYGPGSIVFAYSSATWLMKKAALAGSAVAITGCTNATPIVCTTAAPHGLADGDAACIDSVQGNLAANGCFRASNVTSTTLALKLRDGTTNQAGSGAYAAGGQLQGLNWIAITPAVLNAGRLVGACGSPNAWGHDTTSSPFDRGIYRCGTDNLWHQIMHSQWPGNASNGKRNTAAVLADVGAHHVHFIGIDFADVPVDAEPELAYGPRNNPGIQKLLPGGEIGTVFLGETGSHHIRFDRIVAWSDWTKWGTDISFEAKTRHFELVNSKVSCGRYQLVYIEEGERACNIIATSESLGPVRVANNYLKAGGWCLFSYEGPGWTQHGHVTFERNNCEGMLSDSAYGTSYYSSPARNTGPIFFRTRQPLEAKTGSRMRFQGNFIHGWPVSSGTPVPFALFAGTRFAYTFLVPVSSGGVVTVSNYYTQYDSLAVDQRVVLFGEGTPGIFKVASLYPLTLKNLDNSPYASGARAGASICALDVVHQIQDIEVVGNTFRRIPLGVSFTGEAPYQSECDWGPAERIKVHHNLGEFTLIGQTNGWGGVNPTSSVVNMAWLEGLTNYVQFIHNTSRNTDPTTSTFNTGFQLNGDSTKWQNRGLVVRDNILVAENLGVTGVSGVGSAGLAAKYPGGYIFSGNALLRAGGTISGHPPNNTYPTQSSLAWAAPSVSDYRMKSAGTHRGSTSTDGYPAGHDQRILDRHQGRLRLVNATVGTGTLTVRWKYDGAAACSVDLTQDGFSTFTRTTAGTTVRMQSATISLAAGTWTYQILCPGTVDEPITGTATVI